MAAAMPAPSPEGDQPQDGQPRFFWVPGSVDSNGVELSGPVPPEAMPDYQPDGLPSGLDWKALIDGLAAAGQLGSIDDDWPPDQDALPEQEAAAQAGDGQEQAQHAQDGQHEEQTQPGQGGPRDEAGRGIGAGRLAALALEHMPPGQPLSGWLEVATDAAPELDEDGLTALALAAGKQAARTQAMVLTAVAQLMARTAAADRNVGLLPDGRPAEVTRDGAGQVEMGLNLSHEAAQALAHLSITLTWRLPATGRTLAAGAIDMDRAKIIAQSTGVLPEELARQVEAQILPRAAGMTTAQLRRQLTVLVIRADPQGAEERRKNAEQHADVRLYADDDQTAALIADKLPQIHAAAAWGRINALAWARKKAGLPGSVKQHRAHILLELLLGTLELIPPADGAPPDQPPPPDDQPPPGQPPGHQPPGHQPPGHQPPGHQPDAAPQDETPGQDGAADDDVPVPGDEYAPDDDGLDSTGTDPDQALDSDDDDLDSVSPTWPALGTIPAALARASRRPDGIPSAALLDLTLPWTTYAGLGDLPGTLGRIGAVTAAQARYLARAAEYDPAAQWRIIITDHNGYAIAVTRIRRRGPPGTSPPAGTGLTGRVTLTIGQDTLTRPPPAPGGAGTRPASLAAAALRAASRALQRARDQARDDDAAGGCAHTSAAPGYRPPPRLREHVVARDLTCRSAVCGQPAWRGDLDHTIAYDQGGRTCRCNLGGVCRREHQLKQHPRWDLQQVRPGWFQWTAPSGRTYQTGPESYLC
jgi:hypothetical protein